MARFLADVACLAGIAWGGAKILPVAELQKRLMAILAGAQRFLHQLPDNQLSTLLPNRPRSYAQLTYHIFNIADAFLEHEQGIPLTYESYNRVPSRDRQDKAALAAYGRDVQHCPDAWFAGSGRSSAYQASANVYYGKQTLHDFLERTTWHAGQHARQFMWVTEKLGIALYRPLGPDVFRGLPMPERVWEDDKPDT